MVPSAWRPCPASARPHTCSAAGGTDRFARLEGRAASLRIDPDWNRIGGDLSRVRTCQEGKNCGDQYGPQAVLWSKNLFLNQYLIKLRKDLGGVWMAVGRWRYRGFEVTRRRVRRSPVPHRAPGGSSRVRRPARGEPNCITSGGFQLTHDLGTGPGAHLPGALRTARARRCRPRPATGRRCRPPAAAPVPPAPPASAPVGARS